MGSYLVVKNGQQIKPYDESDIIRQIEEGVLGADDFYWQEGMADWQPISSYSTSHILPGRYFLYIPISRLILMSIVSFGMYHVYWMFMNWDYLRDEKQLKVQPMSRALFGEIFCYSLFRNIHNDPDSNSVQKPAFSAIGLAILWILLAIVRVIVTIGNSALTTAIAVLVPSFLCLVPVQLYINSVRKKQYPALRYFGWTTGHIIMLVIGCIWWSLLILVAVAEVYIE